MPSIVPGFEYDIFISYRQKDNRSDQWVTNFVKALREELDATFKEEISIYFDANPYDGLGDTHHVDESLARKLRCLIFIPIISRTYCDPRSFAWTDEFLAFLKNAGADHYGLKIALPSGNTTSRLLPIRIHDIDEDDKKLIEKEIGFLRSIDFVYQSAGVNRPLTSSDEREHNLNKTTYRDQINKVANAIRETVSGIKNMEAGANHPVSESDKNSSHSKRPFTKELRRRNVARASLVYLLLAAVLWKVVNISGGLLNLTENSISIITLILIVLFPIAMLMAWLYELSPQGFIRTGSVASLQNPFTDEQKKPLTSNTLIGLLAITVAALFLIFPGTANNRTDKELEKSIAVLPFANLSNDPEQQFFADGVMEDILTQLQRMGELKVTSKTSVEQYRNATKNVSQIGDELNVSYLLEGSVRKSDNQIMITAQLIRAGDDSHLWADNFTSEYTTKGLFEIQRKIAENIVHELSLKISPIKIKEITQQQTSSKAAYEHFQKGRQLYGQYNRTSNELAIEQLKLAIQKDPNYAVVYGLLASAFVQKDIRYDQNASWLDSGKLAANRGLELDSLCAECYKGLAFAIQIEGRISQALRYYEKAISINPNHSAAINNSRQQYFEIGDYKNALVAVDRLRKVNPMNFIFNIGGAYQALGNHEAALPYLEKAVELENNVDNLATLMNTHYALGDANHYNEDSRHMYQLTGDSTSIGNDRVISLWMMKKYDEIVSYFEANPDLLGGGNVSSLSRVLRAYSYLKVGKIEKSGNLCRENIKSILAIYGMKADLVEGNGRIWRLAANYSLIDDKGNAIQWMERAINNNYLGRSFGELFFDNIRNEPRFRELIELQEKKRKEAQALMDSYHFPKVEDL